MVAGVFNEQPVRTALEVSGCRLMDPACRPSPGIPYPGLPGESAAI
jgi:hypothetical protein